MTENLYERFKERLMRVRKYFNAESMLNKPLNLPKFFLRLFG